MALVDELTDAEVDEVLVRFDQTEEPLKRRIVAELIAQKTLGSKWQPIETAPKNWSHVLLHCPNDELDNDVTEGYYSCEDGGYDEWRDFYNEKVAPTHWMPLPEPPPTA